MNEPAEEQLHFLDYWRVISNRGWLIAILFLITVITAAVVTWFQPKIYMASTTIQVVPERRDIDVFDRENRAVYDPYFQQTQFENIKQKDVIYPVIEQLKLGERWAKRDGLDQPTYPREYVYLILTRGMLNVQQTRNTPILEIRVESRNPQEAVEMANAIAKSYSVQRLKDLENQSGRGLTQLGEEVKKQDAERKAALAEVERIRTEFNITEVPGSNGNASLSEMVLQKKESDLSEARLDLLARRNRLEKIRELSPTEFQDALGPLGLQDQNIQATRSQYLQSEAQLAELKKQGYDINHPAIISQEAILNKLKQQIEQQLEGIRQGLEVDLSTVQTRVAQMEKELTEFKKSTVTEKSEVYGKFREAQENLERQQTMYEAVSARYKQRNIESEIPSTPVMIKNEAELFPGPVKPNWKLNLGLAAAVGLLLGIATAFFIEYLDTSVKTMEDAERALAIPVLAVIPKGVPALNRDRQDSPHAEGYRILKTKLELTRRDAGVNSFTMVSGGPGEGKSTTLFNLAWVCAQSGQSTLLIDADLRRPTLHTILGVDSRNGLSDYLLGRIPLEHAVMGTPLERLHFMPSGQRSVEAAGMLNSQHMLELVGELKSRYDWVFFDSPPILGVSDASVLAREVDGTIMIVQHRRYPMNISRRVKQAILDVGGNLVGVVLNQVNTKQDSTYGYYNSYYGYAQENGRAASPVSPHRPGPARQLQQPRAVAVQASKQNPRNTHGSAEDY